MRALLAAALLLLVVGCGDDDREGDPVDERPAAERLEQQRDDVRGLTREVAPVLADAVGGGRNKAHGGWRGCTTAEIDGTYGSYQYAVDGRFDAADGPASLLDPVADALRGQEFTVSVTDGRTRDLTAERDGLTITAREYADQPGILVWGVSGECVEVPKSERQTWMNRTEPKPDVLADESG